MMTILCFSTISIGSVVCGSLSAFFAYVLSVVLSVYYNPDHAYMIRQITKYCYLLIGMSSAALVFNTLHHYFWDTVGENLTKRVREKMLETVLKNGVAFFDEEENESSRIFRLGWLWMRIMSGRLLGTGFP
ncbi:Multidrug resistance protein 1 [Orobanche gracilis]